MKKLIIPVLLATLVIGCIPLPVKDFEVYKAASDQFSSKKQNYFIDWIYIKNIEFGNSGYSKFQMNYTVTDKDKIWHIDTYFLSNKWLFIEKMIFNVDGKIYSFDSLPSPNREIGSPISATEVVEENQFILTDDFISQLHSAKSVSVRLEGQDYVQDKNLDPKEIRNMISFIDWSYAQQAPAVAPQHQSTPVPVAQPIVENITPAPQYQPVLVAQPVVENPAPSYQEPQHGQSGKDLRGCLALVDNAAIARCVRDK